MGLGEHVLDLLAGPDIPVRNAVVYHVFLPVRPVLLFAAGYLTFSNSLHDLEGFRLIKSLLDKVDHDIVTTTDTGIDGCLALLDKGLGVTEPNVGTVGKT